MAKVFVVHQDLSLRTNPATGLKEWVPNKNFEAAKKYGDLLDVVPPGQFDNNIAALEQMVAEGLRDFTVDDYLLLVGSPLAIGIATAMAARKMRGRLNVLVWDGYTREYTVMKLDLYPQDNPIVV